MKSFYEVNELEDITINLSFTLPTFLGIGTKKMTSAVVKIECYTPDDSIIGSITRIVDVGSSDGGQTKTVTIAGTDFKTLALGGASEKSMIQDGGQFVITIYSNSTDDANKIGRIEKDIDLEDLAVAEEAPASGFASVNLAAEEVEGSKTASVKMKVPCNKLYEFKPWKHSHIDAYVDSGDIGSNFVLINTSRDNVFKMGYMKNTNYQTSSYIPLEPDTLDSNPITIYTTLIIGKDDSPEMTFFKINPDNDNDHRYLIRLGDGSDNEGPLKMSDYLLQYIPVLGNASSKKFEGIINDGQYDDAVWELIPRDCP